METATSFDLANDAEAAFDWLRKRKEIDPARVGMIGHSEGGLIAPLVAARRKELAFAVLLAGPGIRGDEILIRQSELIARASGASEESIAANRRLQEKVYPFVLDSSLSAEEVERRVRAALASEPEVAKSVDPSELNELLGMVRSPWMRTFLAYDPRPALEATRCPVLALLGEKDLQVPAPPNETALREAFARSANPDATVRVLAGVNHLFQPCTTGAVSEYGDIETTIAPAALDEIGAWITTRFGSKR